MPVRLRALRARWAHAAPLIALTSVAIVGTTAFTATAHTVTLTVDGAQKTIRTHADTVAQVLEDADIDVDGRDAVTPTLTSRVDSGDEIVVRLARRIRVSVDGVPHDVWTTESAVGAALTQTGLAGEGAWVSAPADTPVPLAGMTLSVRAPKAVTVVADGVTRPLTSTAATVADLLAEAGVQARAQDRVGPALDAPVTAGMAVSVVRVDERTETVRVTVPAPVRTVSDADLTVGTRRVVEPGSPGVLERTVRTVLLDGTPSESTVVSERVITEARERVVAKGTRPRPAPAPAPVTARAPATSDGLNWAALARCESGGNPGIVSRNGLYYGLYQFSLGTWRGVGGSGSPAAASPAEQTLRAQILYSRAGARPWPVCGRYLFS